MEAINALRFYQDSDRRLGKHSSAAAERPMAQKHVLDAHRFYLEAEGQGDRAPGKARHHARGSFTSISSSEDLEHMHQDHVQHQRSFSDDDESLDLGSEWYVPQK